MKILDWFTRIETELVVTMLRVDTEHKLCDWHQAVYAGTKAEQNTKATWNGTSAAIIVAVPGRTQRVWRWKRHGPISLVSQTVSTVTAS